MVGTSETFRKKYENWLALTIYWSNCVNDIQESFDEARETITVPQRSTTSVSVATSNSVFCSCRSFMDLARKQKKNEDNRDCNELAFAAIRKL